jgi:hypothetical protein
MRLFLFDWEWIGKMPEQRTLKNRTIIVIRRTGLDAGETGSGLPGMGNSPFRGPDLAHTGTGAGSVAER